MPSDELIVPIDKAFWPKGVLRGLNPLLRELGEKHGNIVIAAKPNVHIMLKGAARDVEAAKPGLRDLIEEHFPDAPIPEELGGDVGMEEQAEEPVAEPVSPEPLSQPAPVAEPARTAAPAVPAALTSEAEPTYPEVKKKREIEAMTSMTFRKQQPKCALNSAPDLMWEITKKNSSFIRKPIRTLPRVWNAEPVNLLGIHSAKFSGLANTQALDVRPKKEGVKESIELIQSRAKASHAQKPVTRVCKKGLNKCPKKGLRQLDIELVGMNYRRDLLEVAREKYMKVQQSFKKKKVVVKSRRIKV